MVKNADNFSLDHTIVVPGVGSSPALATCETNQVLLVGVPVCVSWVFYRLTRLI